MITFLDVLISRPVLGDQRRTLMRPSSFAVTLAKVSDGDGAGSCQHSLYRKVVSSEFPKIPRYSGSLGVRMHYSPKMQKLFKEGLSTKGLNKSALF